MPDAVAGLHPVLADLDGAFDITHGPSPADLNAYYFRLGALAVFLRLCAASRSIAVWALSQKSGVVAKVAANLTAAEMARELPLGHSQRLEELRGAPSLQLSHGRNSSVVVGDADVDVDSDAV